LIQTVTETAPVDHGLPGHGWTMKKMRRWLEDVMGTTISRTTLHQLLEEQGLSWKKCQKVLKKASPEKRAAFVQRFQELYEQVCRTEHRAKSVQATAAALGFTLVPLPGYSPDLNPIEGLWKWMRDQVTKNSAIVPCVTCSMPVKPLSSALISTQSRLSTAFGLNST
jgi:hypothetical protein